MGHPAIRIRLAEAISQLVIAILRDQRQAIQELSDELKPASPVPSFPSCVFQSFLCRQKSR